MYIRIGALLLIISTLAACGHDPKAPTEDNFRAAINERLAKRKNPYCGMVLDGSFTGIPPGELATLMAKRGYLEPIGRNWVASQEGRKLQPPDAPGYGFLACVADGVEVETIVRWTEPNNALGATFSRVTYTVRPTKLKDWVTPDLVPLIPLFAEKSERNISVVLTNTGWIVPNDD